MKPRFLGWLTCVLLALAPALLAQDKAAQDPSSKQARARQTFAELQALMNKLSIALQKTEPERAKTLRLGTRLVQETQIEADMDKALKLLGEENWDASIELMGNIKGNLDKLILLLQNRDLSLKELMEEIERLAQFEKRVEELIQEQKKEKETSAETEALEQQLKDIAEAKAKLEELSQRQKDIRKDTNQQGAAAEPEKNGKLADKEGALQRDTESLAKKLAEIEKKAEALKDKAAAGGKNGNPPAGGEPKPAAGEGKPGEAKPGEGKPGAGKPGEGSGSGSGQSPPKASSAAGQAGQSMGGAQKNLNDNKAEKSLDDMDKALEELEKAKKALTEQEEEMRRRLTQLPFEQQLKKQEGTMGSTDKLAQDMEQSGQGKKKDSEEGTPGTRNVQQAVPKQKSAAGSLKEYKAGKAKPEQQDAQDQLEEAKKKLEDAIAQLRQQLQDEVLKALEERFTAMLAKQREISASTKVTDKRRGDALTAPGELPSSIQERCKELGSGELELAADAGSALKLLQEEGTTAVFPEVIAELEKDLVKVGGMLNGFETAIPTQTRQKEIEDTIQELIDALRRTIEYNDSKGKPGQCNGEPPLVPISAELKMIRSLQKRVNTRTEQYDKQIPQPLRETDEGKREAGDLARKQNRVEELTRKLAQKLNKEEETGGEKKEGGDGK